LAAANLLSAPVIGEGLLESLPCGGSFPFVLRLSPTSPDNLPDLRGSKYSPTGMETTSPSTPGAKRTTSSRRFSVERNVRWHVKRRAQQLPQIIRACIHLSRTRGSLGGPCLMCKLLLMLAICSPSGGPAPLPS